MLDCKGNGNRLLQRPSVPLQTAGKLDGIHVNLLTGTNIQRRNSSPLSGGRRRCEILVALLVSQEQVLLLGNSSSLKVYCAV